MATVQPPLIDNLELTIDQDVDNAIFAITWEVNWPQFAQVTNLAYTEEVKLVGKDVLGQQQVLWVGPILAGGVMPNGDKTTDRSLGDTIGWSDLDEDPGARDEIAAEVTMTPRLPGPVTRQSDVVVVDSP